MPSYGKNSHSKRETAALKYILFIIFGMCLVLVLDRIIIVKAFGKYKCINWFVWFRTYQLTLIY